MCFHLKSRMFCVVGNSQPPHSNLSIPSTSKSNSLSLPTPLSPASIYNGWSFVGYYCSRGYSRNYWFNNRYPVQQEVGFAHRDRLQQPGIRKWVVFPVKMLRLWNVMATAINSLTEENCAQGLCLWEVGEEGRCMEKENWNVSSTIWIWNGYLLSLKAARSRKSIKALGEPFDWDLKLATTPLWWVMMGDT